MCPPAFFLPHIFPKEPILLEMLLLAKKELRPKFGSMYWEKVTVAEHVKANYKDI